MSLPPITVSNAAKFGFEHYSASTLNTFSKSPGNFVMEKLIGVKLPVGAAAFRGRAVEAGLAAMMERGETHGGASKLAEETFDKESALCTDPKREKERAVIPGIIKNAWDVMQAWGKPDIVQEKIEYRVPELPLPFIGFIDFGWSEHKRIIDLKAQLRLSSKIEETHARQIALYNASKGWDWTSGILYATDKKAECYQLENGETHLQSLLKIARAMENYLGMSDSAEFYIDITAPDFDSFYWNDPNARKAGFKIWGY